nr:DALR anticodon-binding domain-containing protein [uncultured Oscillibacter sp.]
MREEAPALASARLRLADDARIVLRNGLKLIGVDAPEHM